MTKINLKDADDMNRYFFGPNANKGLIYTNIHQCVEKGILNNLEEVHFCTITFRKILIFVKLIRIFS